MKHKWKTCEDEEKVIISKQDIKIGNISSTVEEVTNLYKCKECINCGLRKGNTSQGRWKKWHTTVYYKDGELLSFNVLPYKCMHDFLDESDFLIK